MQMGKPRRAAGLFEQAGRLTEALLAYRKAFLRSYAQCDNLLSNNDIKKAQSVWAQVKADYSNIEKLGKTKGEIRTDDFDQLSAQFQAMGEKMAPYMQDESHS
jgi:hypothetical protein